MKKRESGKKSREVDEMRSVVREGERERENLKIKIKLNKSLPLDLS